MLPFSRRRFLQLAGAGIAWTAVPRLPAIEPPAQPSTDGPAALPASPEQMLFNGTSLEGWKPTEFGGGGEVRVEGGAMLLEAGNDLTGVNFTGEIPRSNYEVSLQALRRQGSDFFCALTLPVGKECVTWVIGGWGGSVVGISSVNGEDASENETTQFIKFESNKWYRLRIRVTDDKIAAWLDDDQVVNLTTTEKQLGMRAGEIELSMPFGVATFRTAASYKEIKLRKL